MNHARIDFDNVKESLHTMVFTFLHILLKNYISKTTMRANARELKKLNGKSTYFSSGLKMQLKGKVQSRK